MKDNQSHTNIHLSEWISNEISNWKSGDWTLQRYMNMMSEKFCLFLFKSFLSSQLGGSLSWTNHQRRWQKTQRWNIICSPQIYFSKDMFLKFHQDFQASGALQILRWIKLWLCWLSPSNVVFLAVLASAVQVGRMAVNPGRWAAAVIIEVGEADIWFMLEWLSWWFLLAVWRSGECVRERGMMGLKRKASDGIMGAWQLRISFALNK